MEQLSFALNQPPVYDESHFFVSSSNQEAFSWITAWPKWPNYGLVLTGPSASGKTHLAHLWAARASAIAILPSAIGRTPIPDLFDASHAAIIDGLEHITNEAELFHLLNYTAEYRYALLLTHDDCYVPTLPDLRSRLSALQKAVLSPPDDALLAAILAKQFSDRQLSVAPAVIEFLATRMERSFAVAVALATRLDNMALAQGRAVTLPLAKTVLDTMEDFDSKNQIC